MTTYLVILDDPKQTPTTYQTLEEAFPGRVRKHAPNALFVSTSRAQALDHPSKDHIVRIIGLNDQQGINGIVFPIHEWAGHTQSDTWEWLRNATKS